MEEGLVKIPLKDVTLAGNLLIPKDATGLVVFSHGSGSSRHSPRNQSAAKYLRDEGGLGTLLIDLLTKEEGVLDDKTQELRFKIPFLAHRLSQITDWLRKEPKTKDLSIGYFGASTGAAAAIVAAAQRKDIDAIVSRGGRPDLAGESLVKVEAPVLLIVGGNDLEVLELNKEGLDLIKTTKDLMVIPGASHLFEELGALEDVANFAEKWFSRFL